MNKRTRYTIDVVILFIIIFSSVLVLAVSMDSFHKRSIPFYEDLFAGKAHINIDVSKNRLEIVKDYFVASSKEKTLNINLANVIIFLISSVTSILGLLFLAREGYYYRKTKKNSQLTDGT
jgi:hypothetical protein